MFLDMAVEVCRALSVAQVQKTQYLTDLKQSRIPKSGRRQGRPQCDPGLIHRENPIYGIPPLKPQRTVSTGKNVTIAHLSDLHITGGRDLRQLALLDRMLGEFSRKGYDHIVMTGDIVDAGSPDGWSAVRDLLRHHGFFSWERATIIPGNHDLINLEEELRFYHALNPDPRGRTERIRRRLAEFCAIFRPLISADGNEGACLPFVKVLRFGPVSLAFVAVSSVLAWDGADNPLGARGVVSRETLRALHGPEVSSAIRDSFVIGLLHHAYRVYGTDALVDQAFDWTMEFKNRAEYLRTMQSLGAKLVLHGHFHRFQTYHAGDILFVNGGCFHLDPLRYSELEIGSEGVCRQRFISIGR